MLLDFDGIEGIPKINERLIYQKFPKLSEYISNGKFERSWLIELKDNECNQLLNSKT